MTKAEEILIEKALALESLRRASQEGGLQAVQALMEVIDAAKLVREEREKPS